MTYYITGIHLLLLIFIYQPSTCTGQNIFYSTWIISPDIDPLWGSVGVTVCTVPSNNPATDDTYYVITGTVDQTDGIITERDNILHLDNDGVKIWRAPSIVDTTIIFGEFPEVVAVLNGKLYSPYYYANFQERVGNTGVYTTSREGVIDTILYRQAADNVVYPANVHSVFENDDLIEISFIDVSNRTRPEQVIPRITTMDTLGNIISETTALNQPNLIGIDSEVDEERNVYISWISRARHPTGVDPRRGHVSKITPEGETLWTTDLTVNRGAQIVRPYLTLLHNGDVAMNWTRDTFDFNLQESPPTIYTFTPDGLVQDSFAFHGNLRYVHSLGTAKNGDIIGCGRARTEIGTIGWLFRLTPELDLVWERYVQDHRLGNGAFTDLEHIAATSDDGIIATGGIFHPTRPSDGGGFLRTWVVRLNADGCLSQLPCDSDTIYLQAPVSSSEPVREESEPLFTAYPNPVVDRLSLEVSELARRLGNEFTYTIYTNGGRIMAQGELADGRGVVDTSSLPVGAYQVGLSVGGRAVGVISVVKR